MLVSQHYTQSEPSTVLDRIIINNRLKPLKQLSNITKDINSLDLLNHYEVKQNFAHYFTYNYFTIDFTEYT